MNNKLSIGAAALFCLWAVSLSPLAAEEEIDAIPNADRDNVIVVTASRIAMEKRESGSNITVITAEEIERSGYTDLVTLLKGVEGMHFASNGAFGGMTSIFMRGGKSGNAAFLVDGVKMNNIFATNGGYDMAHIRLGDIARIEITRGANSTTFGSSATGGVINIITKKGVENAFHYGFEAGSFGTMKSRVALERAWEKVSFNLGASAEYSDGISKWEDDKEKDSYRNITLSGGMTINPGRNMSLDVTARYIDSLTDIDNPSGSSNVGLQNAVQNASAMAAFKHAPLQWVEYTLAADYMYYNFQDIDSGTVKYENSVHVPRGRAALEFNIFDVNRVLVGAEWQGEIGKQENADIDKIRFTHAYYVQDHLSLFDRIFINGGIRLELNEQFGHFLSYNAGGSFIVPFTETNIKANWGVGHRMPTFSELYGPWGANPDLKPESSMTVEAGLVQPLWDKRISIAGFYFYGNYDNAIVYTSSYENASSKEYYQGAEAYIEAMPLNWLSFRGSYTYTDSRNEDGERQARRPEHQASFSVTAIIIERIDVFTRISFVADRDDKDYSTWPATEVILPWYIKWDLNIGYRITETMKVYVRGENLTNASYQEAYGYAMPGIGVYGGIQGTF